MLGHAAGMSIDPRPVWIALAEGGPITRLGELNATPALRTTRDATAFAGLLVAARPRIAILAPDARSTS